MKLPSGAALTLCKPVNRDADGEYGELHTMAVASTATSALRDQHIGVFQCPAIDPGGLQGWAMLWNGIYITV